MTAMNQQFRPRELQPREVRREEGIVLTPEQTRSRHARNIAIGLALGFLAVLFYAVTIAKLVHFGPGFLDRPL